MLETDSGGVVEMILSHKADIGFTGTVLEKGRCRYVPFYQDELVIIAPPAGPFERGREEEIRSWIRRTPFILREEGSGTRKEAEKLFARMGVRAEELKTAAVMENPETIKRSVANGMGISGLPQRWKRGG